MRPILLVILLSSTTPVLAQSVTPPAAITAEDIPAIPAALAAQVRPYLEYRSASFQDWDPNARAMLITTRFGNAAQVHRIAAPGADRSQLSFEGEPIANARFSPDGKTVLVTKDVGGGEFFQLYTLNDGRLTLLTDGKSRNTGATWSRNGGLVGFTSTHRNGTDGDLWLVNPADPTSARLLAEVQGGGWSFADFSPDGKTALINHRSSIEQSDLYEIDLATGILARLNRPNNGSVSFNGARYAADGTIFVTSDIGNDVQRLGTVDRVNGFRQMTTGPALWEVEDFDVAPDGSFIAYVRNEAGISKLRLLNPKTGAVLGEAKLPAGVISGLKIASNGEIGFSLASATSPADAWSLDHKTLAATRWTTSETGGLDASKNREPELVSVKSFDGLPVSGFLYTPDPAKFPGKRPLILDIHGGPEGQTRPGYLGRTNYLINEKGIAVFYPNVRGSTGYGKKFVGLDNGPWKREDTVKDVGALLDALTARPDIDAAKVAETGGSYGGYMCYATAIRYGARLKGAICARPISNFVTLLENTESYRRDLRRVEYGDERIPAQRAKLTAISPLTHFAELKVPLMVVTGSNDPRVKPSESYQMVEAVRGEGGKAWHLIAADEGHGYQKKANQDFEFLSRLMFWDEVLK
jgi:dipeptidyl aminopeptidase/acylaminoacyl peptidase